jgi:hypothetical protein
MPARSKRQAGWLGLIASGRRSVPSISQDKAREMLRGSDVKHLPSRVGAPPAHPRARSKGSDRTLSDLISKQKRRRK